MLDAVRHALAGEEAAVPASSLEWVYSKDAAMGTVLALRAPDLRTRVFNITMGRIVTAEEFAAALKAAIPEARVRIQTPPRSAVAVPDMNHVSDLRLAREVLGYAPAYDMPAAVRDMVAWLKSRRAQPAARR